MKLHLPKTLILAIIASSAVYAEAVTENVVADTGSRLLYTTETTNSTYTASRNQSGSSYDVRFKNNLVATDSTFSTDEGWDPWLNEMVGTVTRSGSIIFDGTVEATGCDFTTGNYTSGSIKFNNNVELNGGNTFVSRGGQQIYFTKTATANGDNTFIGGVSATNFVVKSGTQTFVREDNPSNRVNGPTQTLTFSQIGFAEDADDTARIDISAINVPTRTVDGYPKGGAYGGVNFGGPSEITTLEVELQDTLGLSLTDVLTVRETVTIKGNTGVKFGENGMLMFEIDSLAELMGETVELTIPMLNVDNGVNMSNAKVGLYFTENALAEMDAMGSAITFNLDKVTNVDGLELALAVDESTGKTVEEVFGTTSFTTKVGNNNITLGGNVPEPTTATLSLLALAALAGRRRRK